MDFFPKESDTAERKLPAALRMYRVQAHEERGSQFQGWLSPDCGASGKLKFKLRGRVWYTKLQNY